LIFWFFFIKAKEQESPHQGKRKNKGKTTKEHRHAPMAKEHKSPLSLPRFQTDFP